MPHGELKVATAVWETPVMGFGGTGVIGALGVDEPPDGPVESPPQATSAKDSKPTATMPSAAGVNIVFFMNAHQYRRAFMPRTYA
jgi:hypothetical protein